MNFNWNIPIGTAILIAAQFVGGVFILMKVWSSIQHVIESRFQQFELMLNTFKEGDIRELRGDIKTLKTGQDDWTKELRQRTHDLSTEVQLHKMKIDRLERPDRYVRERGGDQV